MEIEQSKVEKQVQEKAQEQAQEKAKKNKKKLRINKQIVISFLAGMAAMLIIVVSVMAAVDPGFLTGSYIDRASGYEFDEATGTIEWYFGYDDNVIIPSSIRGVKVKKIGDYAFERCRCTSITIPDGVISIGNAAFSQCYKLTSITIPNSVTSIGKYAFSICESLTSVTIPDSVQRIDSNAFLSCIRLKSVTIPKSLECIDDYAFTACFDLTIYGSSSYAENYAKANGIPYKAQ